MMKTTCGGVRNRKYGHPNLNILIDFWPESWDDQLGKIDELFRKHIQHNSKYFKTWSIRKLC